MIIKGIDNKIVNRLSKIFKEDKYFKELRNNSLELFNESSKPIFGPDMRIDYDNLVYYDDSYELLKYNELSNNIKTNINKYKLNKKNIIVQSDYNNIYTNLDSDIICTDYNTAYKEYPKIFNQYFNKIVKQDENIFTLLSNTMFNNTLFIYIPPNTKNVLSKIVDINKDNECVINRMLIVVDDNSSLEFFNNITSKSSIKDSIFIQNIEIYLNKHSKCVFKNIQDLSSNIFNISIKRANLESNSSMEWIEVNTGSNSTMSYPTSIMYGKHAHSKIINITGSNTNQQLDTGGRLLHQAPNTKSEIINYSIIKGNGLINNRSTVRISTASISSSSKVKNITYLLDNNSIYNMIPRDILRNNSSNIEHKTKFKRTRKEYKELLNEIIKKYI